MSKILLFSDLHAHMHKSSIKRLEDCLDVLKWVFNTAIKRNIDKIVFAGDLYQDRQKIHTISYEKTFSIIHEYMTKNPSLELYLLLGNHDMWYNDKWDVSSISPLQAIERVSVINFPKTVSIFPDFNLDFLPYTKNPLEDIEKYFNKKKSDVLITHVAINGAKLDGGHRYAEVSVEYEGDMVEIDINTFKGWKKVFSGHYHCAQQMNSVVEYIGSPLELNFGEAFQQKHIIVFDTKTFENEYIINDFSPKHYILHENKVKDYDLNNNFVQVLVDDITSCNIVDMRKKILSENTVNLLEFKENKKKKEDNKDDVQEKFNVLSGEILEKYIKAKDCKNLNFDRLLNIGMKICKEEEV